MVNTGKKGLLNTIIEHGYMEGVLKIKAKKSKGDIVLNITLCDKEEIPLYDFGPCYMTEKTEFVIKGIEVKCKVGRI